MSPTQRTVQIGPDDQLELGRPIFLTHTSYPHHGCQLSIHASLRGLHVAALLLVGARACSGRARRLLFVQNSPHRPDETRRGGEAATARGGDGTTTNCSETNKTHTLVEVFPHVAAAACAAGPR